MSKFSHMTKLVLKNPNTSGFIGNNFEVWFQTKFLCVSNAYFANWACIPSQFLEFPEEELTWYLAQFLLKNARKWKKMDWGEIESL